MEQVVRSSRPSSLLSPKSARCLETLSAVCCCWPPFFWSALRVFLATTSERILAEASAMRSESVVASSLKRRPERVGSFESISIREGWSRMLASTVPSAMAETEGDSPRRKDISPMTSPLLRLATSLEPERSETTPLRMKMADSDALASSIRTSPGLKMVLCPHEAKSCSLNSLPSPTELRMETREGSELAFIEESIDVALLPSLAL
mmetsp:Transcript_18281/g.39291  ORF Transcript_18281/g.39291 Transcript_18281/m.39291 type:complete len:207 (+) Transcript_18281:1170-1790(+)